MTLPINFPSSPEGPPAAAEDSASDARREVSHEGEKAQDKKPRRNLARRKRRIVEIKRDSTVRPPKPKTDVVMGIDFGTAFTKIAIRAPYEPDGDKTAHTVEFCKIPGNPCMLPSAVWVDKAEDDRKKYCWIDKGPGRKQYDEIKIEVISPPDASGPSECALARAAAYLGLVIRGARNWFVDQERLGKNVDLNWHYHIGIPAKVARGPLADHYRDFANAAVTLAGHPQISMWMAKREIRRPRENSNIKLFPEVIAQAYGYARDPAAAEGIHAMVDIGAWTLDVCSFNNRIQDGELTLHSAKVGWRGCMHLHQARMKAIGFAIMPDQFRDWPQLEEYLQPPEKKGIAEIRRGDEDFCDECAKIISGVFYVTLQQWRQMIKQSGLPVIICGGGANIPLFNKAVRRGWDKARPAAVKIRFVPLPEYGLIGQEIDGKNRHRFSVAWGLSYPDIRFKLNVPPAPPRPQSNYPDRYTGKEQV